ncbi:hypothetical protein AB0953_27895 [Streptomyces sp. NPDC046866]|uniref:hypothetical protein n=1 Tax=Streptomyces sp. NPDC046866 TaxID=3154921 RepID=UPI00345349B5
MASGGLQPQHRQLILDALHRPDGGHGGILQLLGDLITDTSRDLPEGDAAEQLDEAAGYASDYPAEHIDRAGPPSRPPSGCDRQRQARHLLFDPARLAGR